MTATAAHRARLEGLRERTRSAREARNRARQTLDAARLAGDQEAQAVAQLSLDSAGEALEVSERLESMLLSSISGVDGHLGESIFDSPEVVSSLERLGHSSMPVGRLDLGQLWSADQVVSMLESGSWGPTRMASTGGSSPTIPPDDPIRMGHIGIRPQPRRRLSVLDLIAAVPLGAGSGFRYLQESGSFDTAQEVEESEIKSEAHVNFDEGELAVQVIAHWLKLLRPQISDVPSLMTTCETRLTFGVMLKLENAVLAGDGAPGRIRGILATEGIQDVPFAPGPLSDLALDGVVAIELGLADANGVVVHPIDWASMLKAQAEVDGRLDSAGAFATEPTRLWGLPVVRSVAIEPGTCLIGDFTQAQVFVRESVNLRTSDADQDDFVRNMVTLLAEGRFGVAIWQPSAFCVVRFSAAGAAGQARTRTRTQTRGEAA
jgi:hypothetical protein